MTTQTQTIRARVATDAIQKVTRIFNGTLLDIANELFQNARRAAATSVAITTNSLGDTCTIRIEDDGRGIPDPQTLLSLGESNWSEATCDAEDPAGMGFFALAGHPTIVDTRTADSGFLIAIPATAWTGDEDITVLPSERPIGTAISFEHPDPDPRAKRDAFTKAALHFPLPVTLDGEELRRTDFLEGATDIVEANGVRIGIYKDVRLDHAPNINFHGVTLSHKLPFVTEERSTHWHVRIDIIDAPELTLVLPARKELFHNEALQTLLSDALAAIYTVIQKQPSHRLPFEKWTQARDFIPNMPPAGADLSPWTATPARENCKSIGTPTPLPENAIIFDEADGFDGTTFQRAIDRHDNLSFKPFHPCPAFVGYDWYDRIPAYRTEEYLYEDASGEPLEQESNTLRPAKITVLLTSSDNDPIRVDTDFTTTQNELYCDDPDETWVAVTEPSDMTPGDLADLITDAAFSAYDGSDADSYETQENRFRHDAHVRAFEVLVSNEAALIEDIRLAFHDKIAWRVPAGTIVTLSYGAGPTTIEITEKPKEEAQ